MPGEGFLPPVIIDVLARSNDVTTTLAKVKTQLADFAKADTETKLGADESQLEAKLAAARQQLGSFAKEVSNCKIGADTAPFWVQIEEMRTLLARDPATLDVDADIKPAMSDLAKLKGEFALLGMEHIAVKLQDPPGNFTKINAELAAWGHIPIEKTVDLTFDTAMASADAAIALAKSDALLSSIGGAATAGGAGGGGGGILGLLGGLLGGGGGDAGGKSFLSMLGWGGGKGIFGLFRGMAKFGSPLSLMGFGAEHVLASGVGIAGSLAGGLLGGGLLGLGAGASMGVGMGTDAAGIGQALNDIRAVEQAQNALRQAQAVYGPNSFQAQAAQGQLNYAKSQVPAVARGAVTAAANTIQQFKTLFDQLTGAAERTGAQIIQQATKIGETYLPTLAKFATQNMAIMQRGLNAKGGLFSWLKQGGSQMINLPGLGKTSVGTGGLSVFTDLEKVFQHNLPSSIRAISEAIQFLGRTADVASRYTGGFVRAVAKLFTHLNGNAFSGWAKEVGKLIGLFRSWLDLFGSLAGAIAALFKPAVGFGKAFADTLRGLLDQVKKWLDLTGTQKALHGLFSVHLVEVIHGIGGAIKAALPILEGLVGGFIKVATWGAKVASAIIGPFDKALSALTKHPIVRTLASWVAGMYLVSKAFTALRAVMLANPITTLIVAIGIAALEIYAHWRGVLTGLKDVWNALKTAATDVRHFLGRVWTDVLRDVESIWGRIKTFFHGTIGQILLFVMNPIAGLVNFLFQHWNTIHKDAVTAWDSLVAFIRKIPGQILGVFKDAGSLLFSAGRAVIQGLINGVRNLAGSAIDAVKHVASSIWHGVTSFFGIHSPSTLMQTAGENIMQGLNLGIGDARHVSTANMHLTTFGNAGIAYLKILGKDFDTLGQELMTRLNGGMLGAQQLPINDITSTAQKMIAALRSQSGAFRSAGQEAGMAIAAGIQGSEPAIAAAVQSVVHVAVMQAVNQAVGGAIAQAQAQIATSYRAGAGATYR